MTLPPEVSTRRAYATAGPPQSPSWPRNPGRDGRMGAPTAAAFTTVSQYGFTAQTTGTGSRHGLTVQ
eukprot:3207739-Heterocapsa_arctica.AAC.1